MSACAIVSRRILPNRIGLCRKAYFDKLGLTSLPVDAIAGDDQHIIHGSKRSKRLSICRDFCFNRVATARMPVKLRCVDRLCIATGHAGDLR
jgi:hypothetical protein